MNIDNTSIDSAHDCRATERISSMTDGLRILQRTDTQKNTVREVRVAAYCRVSTNYSVQLESLDIQMESFRKLIETHQGWRLAGIYADKGLSGTAASHRVEFNRMIEDAKAGKVDFILAKSISRFARNTVDTLRYTRELKMLGVGVLFEEQHLDTTNMTSEMILTIHAAFAQEESHSFSENVKRGVRNRFALGEPKWSATFGLRRVGRENWVIEPTEAALVKRIFNMYVSGKSLPQIGKTLEEEGVPTAKMNSEQDNHWWAHCLATILHNEKYIGDVEMQKDYTVDYLTQKRVNNKDAFLPRYYKENHHEAIVDRETYALAQKISTMKDRHRGSIQYPYYGYLICPHCGAKMVGCKLPSRMYEQAWTCGGFEREEKRKRRERSDCPPVSVKQKYVDRAILRALRDLELEKIPPELRTFVGDYLESQHNFPVEYMLLYKMVDWVSFSTADGYVDYNTVVVHWSWDAKSSVPVTYDRPSEVPTEELVFQENGTFSRRGECGALDPKAAICIHRVMDFVQELEIVDEPQNGIPIVLSMMTKKTKKESGGMTEDNRVDFSAIHFA